LKILFIGTNQSLIFRRWVDWFINRGHTVGIIGKTKNYNSQAKFYDISHPFGNVTQRTSPLGLAFQLIKINRYIKNFKPDVIQCHSTFLYGIFVNLLKKKPNVISVWGSDILINPKKSIIVKYLTKLALRRADLVTSESHFIANACLALAPKIKIELIQFGVDFSVLEKINNVECKFKFSSDKLILFPRGLDSTYNPEVFVEAIPHVLKIIPDAIFIFKYFNNNRNKNNLYTIKQKINALEIHPNNYMFINELSYLELLKLYSISRIFLSIPYSDSISITLVEGMIMGCIPIVSDLEVNHEIVEENKLFVPVDPEKLAHKIMEVFSNYTYYQNYVLNSKRKLLDKFNQQTNMLKMENLYSKIMNKTTYNA